MQLKRQIISLSLVWATLYGCSKKHVPQQNSVPLIVVTGSNSKPAVRSATAAAKKPAARAMVKRAGAPTAVPKVIWVNDKAAKKNFDGRLYYDLEGRRYWKNYVDGKYYLFNKNMYNNSAFKPIIKP